MSPEEQGKKNGENDAAYRQALHTAQNGGVAPATTPAQLMQPGVTPAPTAAPAAPAPVRRGYTDAELMRTGMDGKAYMPGGSRDFAIQQKDFGASMDRVNSGDMSQFNGQVNNADGTQSPVVAGKVQATPSREDNIAAAKADGSFQAKRDKFNANNNGKTMDDNGVISASKMRSTVKDRGTYDTVRTADGGVSVTRSQPKATPAEVMQPSVTPAAPAPSPVAASAAVTPAPEPQTASPSPDTQAGALPTPDAVAAAQQIPNTQSPATINSVAAAMPAPAANEPLPMGAGVGYQSQDLGLPATPAGPVDNSNPFLLPMDRGRGQPAAVPAVASVPSVAPVNPIAPVAPPAPQAVRGDRTGRGWLGGEHDDKIKAAPGNIVKALAGGFGGPAPGQPTTHPVRADTRGVPSNVVLPKPLPVPAVMAPASANGTQAMMPSTQALNQGQLPPLGASATTSPTAKLAMGMKKTFQPAYSVFTRPRQPSPGSIMPA
jgi:hypothetical protein